jgi:hypothetical protein
MAGESHERIAARGRQPVRGSCRRGARVNDKPACASDQAQMKSIGAPTREAVAGRGAIGPRQRRLLLVASVALWLTACERTTPPETRRTDSPRATIERIIAARDSGSYQTLNELLIPERAHDVVKTLMAVDEFRHANEALCKYVRDTFPLDLSQSIDELEWGAHLDVFSRYVQLVDQRVDGETATVTFTVDGRIPVRHAHLVRTDGQWRYDPGSGYDARLPAAFQRMARGLREVLDNLKSGRLAADEIRADPQRLIEEVRVRLQPGIKMLPAAPTTQPSDD